MVRFILITVFTLSCLLCFTQQQEATIKSYLQKAEKLCYDSMNYDATYNLALKAKQLAFHSGKNSLQAKALIFIGIASTELPEKIDSAEKYFEQAEKMINKDDALNLSYIRLNRIILSTKKSGNDDVSKELFSLVKKIETLEDTFLIAESYFAISSFLLSNFKYEKSLYYANKAASYYKKCGYSTKEAIAKIRTYICLTALRKRTYKELEKLFLKVYDETPSLHVGYAKFYYLNSISSFYGKYDFVKSNQACLEAIETIKKYRLNINYLKLLQRIALNYLDMGKNKEALLYAEQAKSYLSSHSCTEFQQMHFYLFASEFYAATNEHKKAFEYRLQYEEIYDRLYMLSTNKHIESIETKYQTEKKNQIIKENRQKIKLLKKEKELSNYRMFFSISILLVTALIILLISGYFITKYKREKTNAVHKREMIELETGKKIKSLEIQILYAQMNPHFVFNCLSAIQHLFLKGDKAGANSKLNTFSRLLRLSIDHVKNDYVSLDDELNFLKHYIDLEQLQFNNPFQYEFLNNCPTPLENLQIPSMILQPYVENAIHHGLKTKEGDKILKIIIAEENDKILLVIEDNGVGRLEAEKIKSESIHKHVSRGLSLVQEKIDAINDLYKDPVKITTIDLFDQDKKNIGTKIEIIFTKREEL